MSNSHLRCPAECPIGHLSETSKDVGRPSMPRHGRLRRRRSDGTAHRKLTTIAVLSTIRSAPLDNQHVTSNPQAGERRISAASSLCRPLVGGSLIHLMNQAIAARRNGMKAILLRPKPVPVTFSYQANCTSDVRSQSSWRAITGTRQLIRDKCCSFCLSEVGRSAGLVVDSAQ
jgi:hypothetical protein